MERNTVEEGGRYTISVRMPAVFVSGKLNATMPYTTMKTPNKVKISKSIIESNIFNAIAIFARVWKVEEEVEITRDKYIKRHWSRNGLLGRFRLGLI